jgi:hypothetical protein
LRENTAFFVAGTLMAFATKDLTEVHGSLYIFDAEK